MNMETPNRNFKCPICGKDVEVVNDCLAKSGAGHQWDVRLCNKRFHMRVHKKVKLGRRKVKILTGKLIEAKKRLLFDENWITPH